MNIQPVSSQVYNQNFGARFVTNDDFMDVISYAMKHKKSDKLIEALDNIDKKFKDTVIEMNLCYTDKNPTLVFSRYIPRWNKTLKQPTGTYVLKRQVDYIGNPKVKPLELAFNRIIKMGRRKANNSTFDNIVAQKDSAKEKGFLF
jgi:hypothetical protein